MKAALVALLLLATPDDSEAERRSMALLAAGDKAFDNLEYEEAAKRYLEAYRVLEAAGERNRAAFLYNAGLAYEQLGSCEKAVVLFDRYLETEQMSVTREIAGTIDRARRCAPTIRIQTNPPGASVLIDGAPIGESPLSVPVRTGEHALRFELDGYRSLETALNVEEGKPRAVVESLVGRAKLGRIDLVVRDISEVSIDDEVIGRGPFERRVKIAHGKHDVRLNRLGCELRELELNVPPGGSVQAAFSPDCVAVPAQAPPHGPYVRGRGDSNAPAWISGGIGVAALAVSGIFVGLSIDGRNAVDAELAKPDDVRVGAEVRRLNDDVGRNNVVAASAGIAGLAALGLAAVLWVTSPEPFDASVAGPAVRW